VRPQIIKAQGSGVKDNLAQEALALWLGSNGGSLLGVEPVGDETRKGDAVARDDAEGAITRSDEMTRSFDDPPEQAVNVRVGLDKKDRINEGMEALWIVDLVKGHFPKPLTLSASQRKP
jgi:hypothetical protein